MMKIVHIVMSMMYGGSERLASDLAYSMQSAGNEVYIIALSKKHSDKGYDKTDKGKKLNIYFIDKKKGFDLRAIAELNALLSKIKPDVVHTHIDSAIYVMPWELFHRRIVKVHTVHNQAEKEFSLAKRRLMWIAYRGLKVTPIAISDQIQKSIIREYKLKKQNVPVIYNGIDVAKFQNKIIKKNNDGILQLLHVGRFFEQKNHIFMLQAVKELVNRGINFHMTFVGEGPLFEDIQSKARDLNIWKYVTFAGTTNCVEDYYSRADVFVLPSIFEGLPLSLMEAYAANLPVIASNVGGVSDICTNGVNGRLIPVNDLEAFVNAVIEMKNDDIRNKYREYNANFIQSYDVSVVANRYLEVYRILAGERGAKA